MLPEEALKCVFGYYCRYIGELENYLCDIYHSPVEAVEAAEAVVNIVVAEMKASIRNRRITNIDRSNWTLNICD